eukprot:TRINITY_DN3667_c0_g1_i1.p2 TRINITY_DN3667_c0_g1~~TRINITY_DN3667_c0_g1_i1.p2  ORF type:complete len:110 (-),score=42.41 TRINITY_DN3667_c0_g1_i1:570-899(-)
MSNIRSLGDLNKDDDKRGGQPNRGGAPPPNHGQQPPNDDPQQPGGLMAGLSNFLFGAGVPQQPAPGGGSGHGNVKEVSSGINAEYGGFTQQHTTIQNTNPPYPYPYPPF